MKNKKKNTIRVTFRLGDFKKHFIVNTSDEACEEFGFKSGDVIITPYGREAVVKGVAPSPVRDNVLWVALKGERGTVCHCGRGDLRKAGYKLKRPRRKEE